MNFKKLNLDSIKTLRQFLTDNPCRICDYTVGGTFMWRDYHKTEYATEDGVLYLKISHPRQAFAPPQGAQEDRHAYDRIIEYCIKNNMPAHVSSVTDKYLEAILKMFPGSKTQTDRAWSDYLYYSEDFVNFAGRKFSGQRNHINRFLREHPHWSFERISEENIADAAALFDKYARENLKDSLTYVEGNVKAFEVLNNLELYQQFGGVLYADGKVIGASLGEIVGDTIFIHAEKADTAYHGSYQMLVNQFARMFVTDAIKYINREEDDGVDGLRASKLSYHPAALLSKHHVELKY